MPKCDFNKVAKQFSNRKLLVCIENVFSGAGALK